MNRGKDSGCMKVTSWTRLLAMILGLCGASAARPGNAQEVQPAAHATIADQGPSWQDYQDLARRLEAAEGHIESLSREQAAMRRLPAVDDDSVPAQEASYGLAREAGTSGLLEAAAPSAAPAAAAPSAGYPKVRLSGFFHLDSAAFGQDTVNLQTLGDIQDGVGFRRARLQALGSVAEFTNYSVEFDFATAGRPSFMDVWGEQTNLPYLNALRIGHFRAPFSMDALTSVKQLEFLERSLPFQAFVPFRRTGMMAYDASEDQNTQWAYGIFASGGFNDAPLGDSRYATDIGDVRGLAFSTRASHLLYYDEPADGRYLLHVGGSYDYTRIRESNLPSGYYQARVIPEVFVGDPAGGGLTAVGTPFFADTGRIQAKDFNLFGVEVAGQYGPAHFQAEYMATSVNQDVGSTLFYDGAYVQAGYFLTGEHRTYNRTVGAFDKVVPYSEFFALGNQGVCGWGAWELVARWSYVNLNDPAANATVIPMLTPPSPNPGRLHDTTLGVNWFWNPNTQVQLNWIHCFLDNAALGDSDCDIIAARFQLAF